MVGVYWFGAPMFPSFAAWGALLAGLILALALALPRSFYTRQTFWALFQLPMGILAMLKALLQVKGRHKEFVHTPKDFQQKP